jgi:hypothetical protein
VLLFPLDSAGQVPACYHNGERPAMAMLLAFGVRRHRGVSGSITSDQARASPATGEGVMTVSAREPREALTRPVVVVGG